MIQRVTLKRQFHPFQAGESFDLKPITMLVGDQGAGKSTLIELMTKYVRQDLQQVNVRFNEEKKRIRNLNMKVENGVAVDSPEDQNFVDLIYTGTFNPVYIDCEKHNPRMSKGEFTKEYKDALLVNLRDESLQRIIQTMDGYKSVFPDKELLNRITNKTIENVGSYFQEKLNMKGGSLLGDDENYGMDMTMAFAYTMQSHGQTIFPLILNSTKDRTGCTIFLDEPETALSIRSQMKLANMILEMSKQNQIIMATHSSILMAVAKEVLSLEHKKWMPFNEFLATQTK